MIRRFLRRRARARGVVMVEALVSLAVAALTLALLTGATWGLRQTQTQADPLQQEAADWLTARRVLQAWAASATTDGERQTAVRFSGGPAQLRLIIDDGTSLDSRPMLYSLDIIRDDALHILRVARFTDVRDVRLAPADARYSTLIVSDQPLTLAYQIAEPSGLPGSVWTDEPTPDQGLPSAIAVARGGERMIVAPVLSMRSAACVSRLGLAGLEEVDCLLR